MGTPAEDDLGSGLAAFKTPERHPGAQVFRRAFAWVQGLRNLAPAPPSTGTVEPICGSLPVLTATLRKLVPL